MSLSPLHTSQLLQFLALLPPTRLIAGGAGAGVKANIYWAAKTEHNTHTHTHKTCTWIPSMAPARLLAATLCKADVKVSYQLSRFVADTHNMWQEGWRPQNKFRLLPAMEHPMRMTFTSKTNCRNAGVRASSAVVRKMRESLRERERARAGVPPGGWLCVSVGLARGSAGGASCNYVGVAAVVFVYPLLGVAAAQPTPTRPNGERSVSKA